MTNGLAEGYGIGHFFQLEVPFVYTGFWYQGKLNGRGGSVWSNGNNYEGNLQHFYLAFLKLSLFLTKSVHNLQCNHECNTVMNK
jgi:hypothetical protein